MADISSRLPRLPQLPPRLMNFFARFPPKLYSAKYTGATIPLSRPKKSSFASSDSSSSQSSAPPGGAVPTDSSSKPDDVAMIESTSSSPPSESPSSTSSPSEQASEFPPNPFLPKRHPETGRWHAPTYSLRRQADLVKLAKKYGVEPLLPPSRKSSAFKEARMLELGLRVRGTGEGQRVKGHKWERKMPAKLDERRRAMEGMPEMIRLWKQLGHGRGWKKYPK